MDKCKCCDMYISKDDYYILNRRLLYLIDQLKETRSVINDTFEVVNDIYSKNDKLTKENDDE